MKKFAMIFVVGAVLALSACAADTRHGGGEHEDYIESSAPYAPERTVGEGDRVFNRSQRK